MPMGKLAMHCATMPLFASYILLDPDMDLAAPRRPHVNLVYTSRETCLKQAEEAAAACRAALAAFTDEQLAAN